jgi:hypothetical protein
MSGDEQELLTYFPEFTEVVNSTKETLDKEYNNLKVVWKDSVKIENRKEFALTINNKTKFTGILFGLKTKLGMMQEESDLQNAWKESEDLILKLLFKDK